MNTPTRILLGLGLAALVALPAPGATPPSPASEEPVRLYTNADLDRLGPASPARATRAAAPAYAGASADWEFVNAWIEREHARLETQRQASHETRAADACPHTTGYGLALAPFGFPIINLRPDPLTRPRPLFPLRERMRRFPTFSP